MSAWSKQNAEQDANATATRLTKAAQSEIKEAAAEICSIRDVDLTECMKHGTWTERLMMCHTQRDDFWECISYCKEKLQQQGYTRVGVDPERVKYDVDTMYTTWFEEKTKTNKHG